MLSTLLFKLQQVKLVQDVCDRLRSFLSNFIQPDLLAATSNKDIHTFEYENPNNQLSNDELGIGTAARLLLIENSDNLEGTHKEDNFFHSIRQFYVECVRKIVAKFPFADLTINDLGILDPRYHFKASSSLVIRLFRRFTPTANLDSILIEFREYQSLPDPQLPVYESLDDFWASVGNLPKPAGVIGEKRFGHLTSFCKILLVLPHSTADPERLFSIIGKVDTSQRSSLLPSTVCNILSAKINLDQECFNTNEFVTPDLIAQARSATTCNLQNSEIDINFEVM